MANERDGRYGWRDCGFCHGTGAHPVQVMDEIHEDGHTEKVDYGIVSVTCHWCSGRGGWPTRRTHYAPAEPLEA